VGVRGGDARGGRVLPVPLPRVSPRHNACSYCTPCCSNSLRACVALGPLHLYISARGWSQCNLDIALATTCVQWRVCERQIFVHLAAALNLLGKCAGPAWRLGPLLAMHLLMLHSYTAPGSPVSSIAVARLQQWRRPCPPLSWAPACSGRAPSALSRPPHPSVVACRCACSQWSSLRPRGLPLTAPARSQVTSALKEVRDRIASIANTQKITEAMKLVAAAKVRRAQEAVINGRPFSENLVKVSGAQAAGAPVRRFVD
jgi:hypothetical protein